MNYPLYNYVKALHIIFIVTWFAGMFYLPRLFIYSTEANEKSEPARTILQQQFKIMSKRLWFGITWPSAILTLIFGTWMGLLYGSLQQWLLIKLVFVITLYGYHLGLQIIYSKIQQGIFKYSSQQLRVWNEIATILLVAIVMIVSVKQAMGLVWSLAGLICFILVLLAAIRLYKLVRKS